MVYLNHVIHVLNFGHTWLRNIGNRIKLQTPYQGSEPNINTTSSCYIKSTELVISTDSISLLLQFRTGEDWIKGWCESWLVECAPVLSTGVGKEAVSGIVNDP